MQEAKVKPRSITLSRIFKLIKENKLTAKDFANKAGVSGNSVTDWKTGRAKPSIDALRKIAKTYKVQLEWLTGDSKYKTKQEEFENFNKKEEKANE